MSAQSTGVIAAQASDRQIMWQPREAAVAESVAQYSRFVGVMKIALPSAAGFLLLLIIVLPFLRQENDKFRIGTSLIKEDAITLSMVNARYYGTDDKGQPYSVTASTAQQRPNDERVIDLKGPKAEITLNRGSWLSIGASAGVYSRDKQVLNLSGDVALFQHDGNEIHTTDAKIQLKEGTASGNGQVRGLGPLGTIEARGFHFSNDDKVLHFHGPARLTLSSKSRAPSAEAKP